MENNHYSFVCSKFFYTSIAFLLIAVFGFQSFAQSNAKSTDDNNFGSLAKVSEKTDSSLLKRPRIVSENKPLEENKAAPNSNEVKTSAKPQVLSVTSSARIFELERQAFDILNQKRKENGLAPIEWNEDMAKVARLHSENMAKFKFFSHAGQDGLMVNDRADSLGFYKWKAIGENIAYNRGYANPAEFAAERWMLSPTHKDNILNKRWQVTGVGLAIADDGTYYFTQVFLQK